MSTLFYRFSILLLLISACNVLYAQPHKTYHHLKKALEHPEKVYHLDLINRNLTSFPKEITKLVNLKHLNLSYNHITNLPPEIGKLTSLTSLNLFNNKLTTLPSEIGRLTDLENLNLKGNPIISLPAEIKNLTYLPADTKHQLYPFIKQKKQAKEHGLETEYQYHYEESQFHDTLAKHIDNYVEQQMKDAMQEALRNFPEPEPPPTPKKENKLVRLKKDGKWGYGTKGKKAVIACKYTKANDFYESIAAVCVDDKWGFVDETGNEVTDLKYDALGNFSDGRTWFMSDGKYGHIDKEGKEYYSDISMQMPEEQKSVKEQKPVKENPQLDLSFFTVEELKDMYRDAFNRKDYQNVQIIQEELQKRSSTIQTLPADTVQYRGTGDPLKGLNVSKAEGMNIGNYFALIIGIDNYKGNWQPLKNAVNDAKAVEALLRNNYKIDHFRTLYNEMATRKNIMQELDWLVENVQPNDNVFVYYSGHGDFKEQLNKGYWVPADAAAANTYEFISNSDIQTYLGGIKSKHTLLVSDACFSGDIFRGEVVAVPFEDNEKYYAKVHDLLSRQALTSGGVEPVADAGTEGHSIFTYYFLKMMNKNQRKYYDAGQLFNDIKIPVINNSDQTPKLLPVKNTGDEGGQFIFIKK
ncbi:MAG: hypothetical protein COA57_15270 [Flavobacteriales bacterium]|nr:MAG: hypothetical protein COA57_15270 [Flavobacteriales bacterium]